MFQRHATIDDSYNLVATDVELDLNETATVPAATIKIMGFAVTHQI